MATLPRRDRKQRSSGERHLPRSMSDDNYCLPSPDSNTKPDVRTLVTTVTNCLLIQFISHVITDNIGIHVHVHLCMFCVFHNLRVINIYKELPCLFY